MTSKLGIMKLKTTNMTNRILVILILSVITTKEWMPLSYEIVVILAAILLFSLAKQKLSQTVADILFSEKTTLKQEILVAGEKAIAYYSLRSTFRYLDVNDLEELVTLVNENNVESLELDSIKIEHILESIENNSLRYAKEILNRENQKEDFVSP